MKFTINTLFDNGSGMKFSSKEEFLKEIAAFIDDAEDGTFFHVDISSDAKFYNED